MPKSIHTKDLYSFMQTPEKHYICPGVPIEKYHDLPIDSDAPIFNSNNGQPAAFVEPIPSKFDKKTYQIFEPVVHVWDVNLAVKPIITCEQ